MSYMLLVSDYDVVQGIDREIIIAASLAVILEAFAIAFMIMIKRRSKDTHEAKRVMLGIASFAVLYAVARVVMLVHDYYATDDFDTILYLFGNCLALLGLISLTFTIEKYMFPKTKKIISIIGLVCIGLIIAGYLFDLLARIGVYTGMISQAGLIFLVYIHAAKHSAGNVRLRALMVILGLVLVVFGQYGGTVFFSTGLFDRVVSQLFSMVFTLIGLVFISYGLVKNSDSKPKVEQNLEP